MTQANANGRRRILKAASAGLVAAAAPSVALAGARALGEDDPAAIPGGDEGERGPKPVYLHGCGWNRALPGVFGQICLTFEMRAELNGTGVGTFRDDVHPEINSQFQIHSARRHGRLYTFEGEVIASRDPSLVGQAVKIVAESLGDGKGKASITVGSEDANLVVIAIIAVLIGLLLPAVQ
jgi:hypothetical protein